MRLRSVHELVGNVSLRQLVVMSELVFEGRAEACSCNRSGVAELIKGCALCPFHAEIDKL